MSEKKDLLDECTQRTNDWYKYYNEHIERARNFLMFLYVDQWEASQRQSRISQSRPVMQFNKLTPIIRSVLGEWRINCPSLDVRGLDQHASQDKVDLIEGIIRQIQVDSDADIVYQLASKSALECGWGACRVVILYENNESFKKCLRIEPIPDFQAAYWDSGAQSPDKSDGDYCGVYTIMSKDKFKKLYPHIKYPQSAPAVGNNYYIRWNTRDTLLICEQYYKDYFTEKMIELSDGNVVTKKEADKILTLQADMLQSSQEYTDMLGFNKLEEVNERSVKDYKIKHKKFIESDFLEETNHPGKILPIPYFEGDSTVIDGERIPIPFVQDAIDNQKLINYLGSELAYMALRARKEMIMGTPDNFKGFESVWRNSDQVQGPLPFNWDKNAGKPEFIKPPVFNGDFLTLYQNTVQDLQQNIGWFDEAQGQETNAVAGRAIDSRQRASKMPVNVYKGNWERGIKQIGKILLDLIPHVYNTNRNVMTRSEDGSSKSIEINKPSSFKMTEDGDYEQNIENDLTIGKYDIEVRVDGSYDAQLAQAMSILIDLARVNPAIANLVPDLMAESSGLRNTPKLVKRLKTLLPPNILAEEEGKPMPPPQQEQPDPRLIIETQKNQLLAQANQNKTKQMALDEQKIMLDAHIAGLERETTLAKAAAEVKKAMTEKDVAILDHVNTLTNTRSKEMIEKHKAIKESRKKKNESKSTKPKKR